MDINELISSLYAVRSQCEELCGQAETIANFACDNADKTLAEMIDLELGYINYRLSSLLDEDIANRRNEIPCEIDIIDF